MNLMLHKTLCCIWYTATRGRLHVTCLVM